MKTIYLVFCKACKLMYDGNAQCCEELDHVWVEIDEETNEIIRELKPDELL